MFVATDTAWAPWWVVNSDDKKRARLNVISHLLDRIPYEPLKHRVVELPDRQKPSSYRESDVPLHYVPTPYWPIARNMEYGRHSQSYLERRSRTS